jgi:hypothetical protein
LLFEIRRTYITCLHDVLSLNNSTFGDNVDRIYSIEFGIKETTDTARCVSYIDIHLKIDSEGRLRMKRDDSIFSL